MEVEHRSPLELLMEEFRRSFLRVVEGSAQTPTEVVDACLAESEEIFRQRLLADVVGEVGYWDGQYRVAVLRQAQRFAQCGWPASYVEVDLRNVGGVNAKLGHTGCNNVLFLPVARILRDCLHEALEIPQLGKAEQVGRIRELLGQDFCDDDLSAIVQTLRGGWVEMFRHGGDEFSFVVVGYPDRLLTALLDKAYREVARHEDEQGLKFLPHPKHLFSFRCHWGISISYGVAAADESLEPKDIFRAADTRVEEMKRTGHVSYGRGTGSAALAKPRYGLCDYPKLWALALRVFVTGK